MPFDMHEQNSVVWLTASNLAEQPAIHHGFSTRKGGVSAAPWDSLNLRSAAACGDDPAAVEENYRRFCAVIGADAQRVVLSKQVHETNVRRCTAADAGMGLWRDRNFDSADALITNEKDLPLFVFSADCGILLLADPDHHAVGAIHAGWRGCSGGIVEKTVQAMQRDFGTDPARLIAALGPCIGQCCFETDSDVPDAMRKALGADAEPYLRWDDPKWHIDLAGLNRQWLLHAGLLPEHIEVCDLCTACRPDLFWSHRKMGNARGVQCAAIVLC